jgi:hypothetical protein
MIFHSIKDIRNNPYPNHESEQTKNQKLFEINNKLTELIELNKKLIDINCVTGGNIIGRLESIRDNLQS